MNRDSYDIRKEQMLSWYWWGVPTFFHCEWDADPKNADIGLIGLPHSSGNGSTERDQHLAPRSVRDVSGRYYRRPNEALHMVPWDVARIKDLGDVPLPEAMANDITVGHIEEYYKWVDSCLTRPVTIGGDHSITGPILKALGGKDGNLSDGRKLSLVHFDAHRDDYQHMPHWLGNRRSAGHWAAYTVEEGHVDPERSLQIGIRGNQSVLKENREDSDYGYKVITADHFREMGVEAVSRTIRERVGDNPVYVTFDMDSLDPADAPGVSNLEAGYAGLRSFEAINVLHSMRGLNIVGADIVCMMPTTDSPNRITALNAMVLMFEFSSLIADYISSNNK